MKKLLFILFPIICQAQTKFYLNLGVVCPIQPTRNAAWNVFSGNTFNMTKPVKDGSTIASTQSGNTGAAAVRKILIKTFISEPLAAQTISSGSTVSGQIRGNMSSVSSRTGQGWMYFRIINPDGTVASDVNSLSTTSAGWTTTLRNWQYSLTLGSNLTITAGQRFLFEIGWNYQTGSNTATNGTNSYGSSSATDLTVAGTETTANNPFITFSQTIIFQRKGFF